MREQPSDTIRATIWYKERASLETFLYLGSSSLHDSPPIPRLGENSRPVVRAGGRDLTFKQRKRHSYVRFIWGGRHVRARRNMAQSDGPTVREVGLAEPGATEF